MIKNVILKKILLWAIVPLVTVLISAGVYAAYLTNKVAEVLDDESEARQELDRGEVSKKREPEIIIDPASDNISILFLGIDSSNAKGRGGAARTDAMILATFNEKAKTIQFLSIPRDTYAYLPKVGYYDRISHAHAFNGADGSVAAVEELLDIPVDYYVRLNFYGFIDIIDALGGVEVNVPFTFYEQDSNDNKNAILLKKGKQLLDGEHALAFARMRKYDSDFKRGARQQQVLKAVIKKTASFGSVTKYPRLIEAIKKNIVTNMDFSEVFSLHDYATKGSELEITTLELKGYDWNNKAEKNKYYFKVHDDSLTEIKAQLKTHLEIE